MAWFTRFTRFGDMHLVYGQEAGMSCGIASLMMCVFKLNKLTPGRTAVTVEQDIYRAYEGASGGAAYQPEQVGTYGDRLATILNGFTSGTWHWHTTPPNDVPQTLIDKVGTSTIGPTVDVEPVILGVDWDQGGAHWVVVDTIRDVFGNHYATVCDPWDANVHIQRFSTGHPFRYNAGEGGLSVNVWGSSIAEARRQEYGNASRGQVKTWGMIYRD
ncbi:MAG TPA: hypothetical protein VG939_22490 [Caulobacteraceae bacterium]|nr:hypothetical protein [Caulobacteraceae bacterium]